MIQLFSEGAYLVDGTTLVKESEAEALKQLTGEVVSKEEASKNTIAYGILRDHNTSGNVCWNYSDSKSIRNREIPGTICIDKLS